MANFLNPSILISIFIKSYLLYVGKSSTYCQNAWKNRWLTGHFSSDGKKMFRKGNRKYKSQMKSEKLKAAGIFKKSAI